MTDGSIKISKKGNILEMPLEERIKYISDDMLYNGEELAFLKVRDEVSGRAMTRMDKSLAGSEKYLLRGRKIMTELDNLIEKASKKAKN